jgi:dihydrofolate reductase
MGQIIMWNQLSADGFYAAPDGSLDWVVQDVEVQRAGIAGMATTGTLLFGRKTFEMFASFWPRLLDAPETPDPHGGPGGPELLTFARFLTDTPKLVFSRTLREPGWKHSKVIREVDAAAIAAMKRDARKDLLIMGSASLVAQLTRLRLIDEYQLSVSPVLLGRGRTLFGDLDTRTDLALVEARPFPSGCLRLRYAPR